MVTNTNKNKIFTQGNIKNHVGIMDSLSETKSDIALSEMHSFSC